MTAKALNTSSLAGWARLVATMTLLAGAGGCAAPTPENGSGGNGSHEPPPVNVAVMKLELSELTEKLVLTGRIEPWVEVDVSTELGGTVQEIGFEKGQRVRKGKVLARIGTDLLKAALEEAEAALVEAEANYNKTKELFARQAVPRQELIRYTSLYRAAQARVAIARLRVERSIIRAPITGTAISRLVEVGEVVVPGAPITTIHQLSRLKVSVGVPETDIASFRLGGEATIEVDAFPRTTFPGKIHFLGLDATGKDRSFPSEVAIGNPRGMLRPGMMARVSLVKQHLANVVVVPMDALIDREEGSVAYVSVGDHAEERLVSLGPKEGNRVVIEDGLSPGEELIVSGHRNLVEGQPILVVN